MPLPLNTALSATFEFTKAGALFDPTPLPTLIDARYPDASSPSLVGLSHPAVGVFTATVFASNLVTQIGSYTALAYTSDATADAGGYAGYEWAEVGNNLITVAGTTQIVSNGPTNGTRTYTRGEDRKAADGLAWIVNAPSGYPSFSGGSNARAVFNGSVTVTGSILNATQLSFDLLATAMASVPPGEVRFYVIDANGNTLEPEVSQLKIQ